MKWNPPAGLEGLTFAALLVNAIVYFAYFYLVSRVAGVIVPLLVVAVITLLATVFVASGFRFAPACGALVALATTALDVSQPESVYNLAHPSTVSFFAVGVLILASALIAVVSGGGATIQNYRGSEQRTPRSLKVALVLLVGIVGGMLLTSLLVAANPVQGFASTNIMTDPTVHMGPGSFQQTIVHIPKGEDLTMIDDGPFDHVLRNGMWAPNGSVVATAEAGAPTVGDLAVNGNSVEIGPFNTAGVFHIYCTIHRGMSLVVVVT